MPVFLVLVFLGGVAATLMFKSWLKACENAQKARIAREDAQRAEEEVEAPKRRRKN